MPGINGDHDMSDATPGAQENGYEEEGTRQEKQKLRILPNSSDTAASFQFKNEDHTLGNALRYLIMKNPDVEFCGYTIPHPSEPNMNLRIQTYDGANVYDVLRKGLDDLADLCDVVESKFTEARDEFNAANPDRANAENGR